jgi:hypothetical protein
METYEENRSSIRYAPVAVAMAGVMSVSAACSTDVRGNEAPPRVTVVGTPPEVTVPEESSASAAPPSPSDLPTTITPSSETTSAACETPYVPAFPGSRYKQSNADDMQKQLDALQVAKSPQEKVTLRDVVNAEIISLNALADPAYADAFTYANQQTTGLPTAQELLDKRFTGPDCVTGEQLQQVSDLYDTLLTGLAPKAGRQMSDTAQAAWKELKKAKDAFVQKYHDQVGHQ